MDKGILRYVLMSLSVAWTLAECHPPSLRIRGHLNRRCATVFTGIHCRGPIKYLSINDFNNDLEREWDNKISSIVVDHGCELQAWLRADFTGETTIFPTGIFRDLRRFPWRCFSNGMCANWENVITSFRCTCRS